MKYYDVLMHYITILLPADMYCFLTRHKWVCPWFCSSVNPSQFTSKSYSNVFFYFKKRTICMYKY